MKNQLDLFDNLMLMIINSTDKSKTESKTRAFVSVTGGENAKTLDISINMLNKDSLP